MAHLYFTIHITLEKEEVLNISVKMHTKLYIYLLILSNKT